MWQSIVDFIRKVPLIGGLFDDRPKVVMIRLAGVISDSSLKRRGSFSYAKVAGYIDNAFDKKPAAVALIVNCPGGAAAQTSLIASHIRRLAQEKEIPVYAFIEDVAASGGYWLACAADEIHAQESSVVGSIGVISASFGFDGFLSRHGISRRVHTAGKEKAFLDPFMPERKEDVARLQEIQKDIHFAFREWVKERRGSRLKGNDKELFEGAFWAGGAALDHGLVDGIADMESLMREKYGEKIRFIDCSPDKPLFSFLPGFGTSHDGALADTLLAAVEDRAFWSRYGL